MRKIILLLFLSSLSMPSMAQFFSGEISYRVKIIPKKKNLNVDSLMKLQQGESSNYLITNGYYKSTYLDKGTFTYSYTYHNDTKRMYDERAEDDYITFRDSRKGNTSRIRSVPYRDSVKVILGHKCYMVERVYEGYISKTYYATDLKIDPESFKEHEVGDWYNQIKEVNGAVSLTSINEYATHFEINEVTKVGARTLKPEDFALPNKMIVASETALEKPIGLVPLTQDAISCYRTKMATALSNKSVDKFRSYISLIISDKGEVMHLSPYKKDEYELYKAAIDILSNCGIKFTPGQIEGKDVSTHVYFPIDFTK